jgi:hypothetical protein
MPTAVGDYDQLAIGAGWSWTVYFVPYLRKYLRSYYGAAVSQGTPRKATHQRSSSHSTIASLPVALRSISACSSCNAKPSHAESAHTPSAPVSERLQCSPRTQ